MRGWVMHVIRGRGWGHRGRLARLRENTQLTKQKDSSKSLQRSSGFHAVLYFHTETCFF